MASLFSYYSKIELLNSKIIWYLADLKFKVERQVVGCMDNIYKLLYFSIYNYICINALILMGKMAVIFLVFRNQLKIFTLELIENPINKFSLNHSLKVPITFINQEIPVLMLLLINKILNLINQ